MLLKRYGAHYHSVEPNFDSKALNEIGFRRDQRFSIPADEFPERYHLAETHEISAEAEGAVQDETEQLLLDRLEEQLQQLLDSLAEGEVLVFENEAGHDYPKTRQRTQNVVEEGQNRLHFHYSLRPPLRIGRYRATS